MKHVYLVLTDWFGNGDAVVVDSVWSSFNRAKDQIATLQITWAGIRYGGSVYMTRMQVNKTYE